MLSPHVLLLVAGRLSVEPDMAEQAGDEDGEDAEMADGGGGSVGNEPPSAQRCSFAHLRRFFGC